VQILASKKVKIYLITINFIMNKYLLLTTLSIVPIVTFMEASHSSSPCYLIDANGNQVNLGFICNVIKPTSPPQVTTPPSPPTATNNPPVSATTQNTTAPTPVITNVGNINTTPQEQASPSRPTRRILRILDNRSNSGNTNP
jgi:hypothetical protein